MAWVILFIPLAVWMSMALAAHFNPLSLAIMSVVIFVFCLVELNQIKKDQERSKATFLIMCLALASLVGGVFFR
jgi:hypothetical protein